MNVQIVNMNGRIGNEEESIKKVKHKYVDNYKEMLEDMNDT